MAGSWWLVHTRPRNEKALSRDLQESSIEHFLPVARFRRRHGGRTAEVELPLFAGYLFLCGDEQDRYRTLATNRVVNVIRVSNQDRIRSELRHVYQLTNRAGDIDVFPGIRRGKRCRVIRGMLRGLEGVVLRRRDACRVSVAVEMLGQSAEAEIDASCLEVIDGE